MGGVGNALYFHCYIVETIVEPLLFKLILDFFQRIYDNFPFQIRHHCSIMPDLLCAPKQTRHALLRKHFSESYPCRCNSELQKLSTDMEV